MSRESGILGAAVERAALAGQRGLAPTRRVPDGAGTAGGSFPSQATLDRRAARRLRRGQTEIEAQVDLHGMRQKEAHAALKRFLFVCHGRGQRLVLVITGKGTASGPDDKSLGSSGAPERGVLRRSVPLWLEEPDLRPLVVGFAPAAPHHGGDGALYVQLRKAERTRR
jgi:DNA-nicking Smr family endonuclease